MNLIISQPTDNQRILFKNEESNFPERIILSLSLSFYLANKPPISFKIQHAQLPKC